MVKQNIKINANKVSGKEGQHLGHIAWTSIDGLSYHTTSVNHRIPILPTVCGYDAKLPTALDFYTPRLKSLTVELSMAGNFFKRRQVV